MIIDLNIPDELKKVLNSIKRKDTRKALLTIYSALIYKDNKYNKCIKDRYFPAPSAYLRRINYKYYNYIDILLKNNIIEFNSLNNGYKDIDLFTDELYKKKYYNTHTGDCAQYKFIIDTTQGDTINFEVKPHLYSNENWYKTSLYSLNYLGLSTRIGRDNFGRRVHTIITANTHIEGFESYKTIFNAIGGYSTIDIAESQPHHLYSFLKDMMVIDDNFIPGSVYTILEEKLDSIADRNEAKKEFARWINDKAYHSDIDNLFPLLSKFIYKYKKQNGAKSLGAKLQRLESNIIIDGLLDNIATDLNIDFCLTVHDSLIVKDEYSDRVLEYCENKYKDLKFKKEKL